MKNCKIYTEEILDIKSQDDLDSIYNAYSRKIKVRYCCYNCNQTTIVNLRHLHDVGFPALCAKCKSERSSLIKYGVKHPSKCKDVIGRISDTKLKKYGDSKYNNSKAAKETNSKKTELDKLKINEKRKNTKLAKYGIKMCSEDGLYRISKAQKENAKTRLEKTFATKLERYGDGNYCNADKIKETKMINHGNPNYYNKDKMKETNKLKYGKEYYFQTDEFKLKCRETSEKLYNVSWPSKSDSVKDKIKETCISKYGTTTPLSSQIIRDKIKESCLLKYGVPYAPSHFSPVRSKLEDSISEFIKELNLEFVTNNRTVLKGKELDIYFPKLKKAIEVQGTYWHADPRFYDENWINESKGLSAKEIWKYDNEKIKNAESKGISVFLIWEYDWLNFTDTVKSKLKDFLDD